MRVREGGEGEEGRMDGSGSHPGEDERVEGRVVVLIFGTKRGNIMTKSLRHTQPLKYLTELNFCNLR